jgi:hypothetical protein
VIFVSKLGLPVCCGGYLFTLWWSLQLPLGGAGLGLQTVFFFFFLIFYFYPVFILLYFWQPWI